MGKFVKHQALIIICALALLLSPALALGATTQNLKVKFFDVGAGDCIYIETPNGADILIDAGTSTEGASVVDQLLQEEPGMNLEYVISTHPDADHAGGLQEVFQRMWVKAFYYPRDIAYSTYTAQNVISLAKSEPYCKMLDPKRGTSIYSGGARLEFVQSTTNYDTDNKDSVMTYLDYGTLEVLFTGDAEKGAEAAGKAYNVDVLQVPHHGSRYSSSSIFIKKYDPERVVFLTDGVSYGHPHQDTIKRHKAYDSNILAYRTDKNGNISLYGNGRSWWFDKADIAKRIGAYIN